MKRSIMSLMLLCAAGNLFGCNRVIPNTNDTTPPQIEILVRNADGDFVPASSAQLRAAGTGELYWSCAVSDAGGVKTAALKYSWTVDSCNVDGAVYYCIADYAPRPQPQNIVETPDADGKVSDRVVLLSKVKAPITCRCLGGDTGVPFGTTIKATCSGSNWSSSLVNQSAQKVLTIHLK